MIVTKLCSNVIRHANFKDTHFLVTLEYYKPQFVITIKDTGRDFAQKDTLPVGAMRSGIDGSERYSGYGISLLEGLSDKVDFTETDPHGATVRVKKACTTKLRRMPTKLPHQTNIRTVSWRRVRTER